MGILDIFKKKVKKKVRASLWAGRKNGMEKICDIEYGSDEELMNDIHTCLESAKSEGYPIDRVKKLYLVDANGNLTPLTNPFLVEEEELSSHQGRKRKSASLSEELSVDMIGKVFEAFATNVLSFMNTYSSINQKLMDGMVNAIGSTAEPIIKSVLLSSTKIRKAIENSIEEVERSEKGSVGFRTLSDVATIAGFLMDLASNPKKYESVFRLLRTSGSGFGQGGGDDKSD